MCEQHVRSVGHGYEWGWMHHVTNLKSILIADRLKVLHGLHVNCLSWAS